MHISDRKLKNNKQRRYSALQTVLLAVIAILTMAILHGVMSYRDLVAEVLPAEDNMELQESGETNTECGNFDKTLEEFAEKHGLNVKDWPEDLIELGRCNPEAVTFVLHYPLKKDDITDVNLMEYQNCNEVPLLLQWDERWGYRDYAGNVFGLTGCGPACLSMVSIYLLNDPTYSPSYIARFSEENGFYEEGNGSTWTLISKGGKLLGLNVTEIPLNKERIFKNLEVGNPIICVMGPGDFTTTGHFIVMTGLVDGKIKVNDPNSRLRSDKLWDYEDIKLQIRNIWVCRK